MENKAKEILKERYPHHRLYDDKSFQLEHFTGEEMIEFAIEIAKASLEKASESATAFLGEDKGGEDIPVVSKGSITNESNIILL